MSYSTIIALIFVGIIIALLAGIIYAISQKNTQCSGSFASMAAFHDLQNAEKQKAMEIVVEQKADKKWTEEESGEGKSKKDIHDGSRNL